MAYTLYNKKLDQLLTHPKIGLWYTNDLAEAEKMLLVCKEYIRTFNHEDYEKEFVIVDAETGKETCQKSPLPEED